MNRIKIALVYQSLSNSEEYEVETVWANKKDEFYQVDNIPFFAKNIALGDIISVEFDKEEDTYYFDELITPSGNSVVRVIAENKSLIPAIGLEVEKLGCSWESLKNSLLVSVNIPSKIDYEKVITYIKESSSIFDYEEACLGMN